MEFLSIDRERIERSPNNPRKYFDEEKLAELATSIGQHGIHQPLVVRRVENDDGDEVFELVAGERRLRAAEIAGLDEVPCVVREMTDEEADEARLVENVQRADLTPLEEADGYRLLQERYRQTVDDIAAKMGRSKAAIYARLKLCDLGAEGRAALAEGKLTASTALLVARIPAELQAKAVEALTDAGEVWSFRQAADYVQRNFMLRLALAPFDRTDAALPGGACTSCPKRTGAQRELFADINDLDLCTDPACYRSKVDAAWEKKAAAARKRGLRVIEGEEAKELFPYGNRPSGDDFASLDDSEWIGNEQKSYREILGKKAKVVAIARTPKGDIVELVAAEVVEQAIDALRGDDEDDAGSSSAESRKEAQLKRAAEEAERERVKEVKRRAAEAAVPMLVEAAEETRSMKGLLRALIDREIDMAGAPEEALAKRRGIEIGEDDNGHEVWARALDKMTEAQLRGFLVEFIVGGVNVSYSGEYDSAFWKLCAALGVELGPLEASAKKKIAAEEKKAAKGGR